MKTMIRVAMALALVLSVVSMARAEETTLSGTMVCAKCTLKKADATKCQDVLVVKDDKGATTEYYIAKNAASDGGGPPVLEGSQGHGHRHRLRKGRQAVDRGEQDRQGKDVDRFRR